jgi:hypothetical protein
MKNNGRSGVGFVWSEVVRVEVSLFLVSSQQHACRYETPNGESLAPGYYVVLWPAGSCRSSYGRELRYIGPCGTQSAARLLQTSAMGLGLLDMPVDGPRAAGPVPSGVEPQQPAQLPAALANALSCQVPVFASAGAS